MDDNEKMTNHRFDIFAVLSLFALVGTSSVRVTAREVSHLLELQKVLLFFRRHFTFCSQTLIFSKSLLFSEIKCLKIN